MSNCTNNFIKRVIGVTRTFNWTITTNGAAVPLVAEDLTLQLVPPRGEAVSLPFDVDDNIVSFTWQGEDQHIIGCYSLILWANFGEENQRRVDIHNFVELIPWSDRQSGEYSDLVEETIELETADFGENIMVVDNLNSTSATDALSANMGRQLNVTKQDVIQDLAAIRSGAAAGAAVKEWAKNDPLITDDATQVSASKLAFNGNIFEQWVPGIASSIGLKGIAGFLKLADISQWDSAYNDRMIPTVAAVKAKLQAVLTALATIEAVIPSQASSTNKLTDKDYVDGAIATNTANFVGTFDTLAELQAVQNPTKNDYGFVIESDAQGNEYYDRYKYTGTQWLFEYKVESTPFTAEQWAAIQSGITAALVSKLSALPTNAELNTALAAKQPVIDDLTTIRSGAAAGATAYQKPASGIPASDMAAAVQTSLGKADAAAPQSTTYTKSEVDAALALKQTSSQIATINGSDITHGGNVTIVAAEGQTITIDAAPTAGSNNAVSSGGTFKALSELGENVNLDINGESTIFKDYNWSSGYVNSSGNVVSSTASIFCQPIYMKKGDVLRYKTGSTYSNAVIKVADNTPISVGQSGIAVSTLINAATASTEYAVAFQEDMYVVISVLANDYTLTVSRKKNSSIDGRLIPLEKSYNDLITTSPVVEHEPVNWLDLNSPDFVTGKFITSTGDLGNGSNYNTSGYVPVKQGKTYRLAVFNAAGTEIVNRPQFAYGINEYNADKIKIRTIYNATSWPATYTPSEDAVFFRFSSNGLGSETMLFYDDEPSVFSEYFAPYTTGGECILKDNVVGNSNIMDDAISKVKLKKGALSKRFAGYKQSGQLSNGDNISTPVVRVKQNYVVESTVIGTIESVRVGVSNAWVDVTPTTLTTHFGTTEEVVTNHGLTLGNRTTIVIHSIELYSTSVNATVTLYDDYGNSYSKNIYYWYDVTGAAFVTNNGSANITATISYSLQDITKDIWLFGDSYMESGARRWPWRLNDMGYGEWMVNAIGGETGGQGLQNLRELLTLGTAPSYIVWCYGMNGGADSNSSVNSGWLTQETEFISICEEYDITPILATIPSVPSQIHIELNNWVRNSGYAYIDFAAAVEDSQDSRNLWRGWGADDSTPAENALLSSDKVHPSSKGNIVLALQALQDFPQLAVKNQ